MLPRPAACRYGAVAGRVVRRILCDRRARDLRGRRSRCRVATVSARRRRRSRICSWGWSPPLPCPRRDRPPQRVCGLSVVPAPVSIRPDASAPRATSPPRSRSMTKAAMLWVPPPQRGWRRREEPPPGSYPPPPPLPPPPPPPSPSPGPSSRPWRGARPSAAATRPPALPPTGRGARRQRPAGPRDRRAARRRRRGGRRHEALGEGGKGRREGRERPRCRRRRVSKGPPGLCRLGEYSSSLLAPWSWCLAPATMPPRRAPLSCCQRV